MDKNFQARLRNAAALNASPWIAALALIAGAAVARFLIFLTPVNGSDVEKAKALGIVSVSILAGYSKSADSLAYAVGLTSAIITSIAIWVFWAMRVGQNALAEDSSASWTVPRSRWLEAGIVTLIAFVLFGHFWNGRAATFSAWSTLSEEGEMLAWVDTVFRGGALWRDTFCLYGPLSVWSVAALFTIFQPSLGLWRCWIFALNPLGLIAAYFLLRATTRTRSAAIIGALAFGIFSSPIIPAMSWSLLRVGLGLAAIAALARALDRNKTGWFIATGIFGGAAFLYSQEVGIACGLAVGVVLVLQPKRRTMSIFWTGLGAALLVIPALIYLVATHSLNATIENLFFFPRVRMLGFAAKPFPPLALNAVSLRAYFVPTVLVVSAFRTGTKLLWGLRDARVLTELALFVFGVLLFNSALSRPDNTHCAFVAAPAFVLLAGLIEDACFSIRRARSPIGAVVSLFLCFASLIPWIPIARETLASLIEPSSGRTLDLPRGGSALLPEEFAYDLEETVHAIQSRTSPTESFWVFPNEALLYFLADRPQPTRFPQALFAVTRAQREDLVAELERTRPRWTVVYRDAFEIDGIPYKVALPEVVAYLEANYQVEDNFGSFALLRRRN